MRLPQNSTLTNKSPSSIHRIIQVLQVIVNNTFEPKHTLQNHSQLKSGIE